jgi:hypothetical protein
MSKKEKKKIISEDKKAIAALKSRATSQSLPFIADSDDHCETSHVAYMHVAPILSYIATRIGRECSSSTLKIYDPYYCAGTVIQHLAKLGFQNVYNKPEDFYQVIQEQRLPHHDVVVTNPPYSGDHFERLLKFLCDNDNNNDKKKKPALLLIPEHLSKKKSIQQYLDKFFFLTPPERYFYWTPEGLRPNEEKEDDVNDGEDVTNNKKQKKKKNKKSRQHKNLMLGSRNSPFVSHWFIRTDPVVPKEEMISLIERGEIQLVDGCNVYSRQEDIVQMNSFRKRKGQEVVEVKNDSTTAEKEDEIEQQQSQEERQRKRRRKKKRAKKEDKIQTSDGSNPFF